MKKFNLFLLIAIAVTVSLTASAQRAMLTAEIPFDFTVGDTSLSSGHYSIQMLDSAALIIRSTSGKSAMITLSNSAAGPNTPRSSRLVFKSYGNQYFLSTVEWEGGPYRALVPSKLETELAKRVPSPKSLEVATK
jgi:hypothetical protein